MYGMYSQLVFRPSTPIRFGKTRLIFINCLKACNCCTLMDIIACFALPKTSLLFQKSSNYLYYRGSPLSTIFGIWKKSYYAKFVLVSTTQPISTSTVYSTQKFHQYGFQYIALKNRTSGNRTTGNRTSRGPPVPRLLKDSIWCLYDDIAQSHYLEWLE